MAAVGDDDGLLGGAVTSRAVLLHLHNNLRSHLAVDILQINHFSKYSVLAVQVWGVDGGDEELGSVGIGTYVFIRRMRYNIKVKNKKT